MANIVIPRGATLKEMCERACLAHAEGGPAAGASLRVFLRELTEHVAALEEGRPPKAIYDEPIEFREFSLKRETPSSPSDIKYSDASIEIAGFRLTGKGVDADGTVGDDFAQLGSEIVRADVAMLLDEIGAVSKARTDGPEDQPPQSGVVTPSMVKRRFERMFSERCGGRPSPIRVEVELDGAFALKFFDVATGKRLAGYEEIAKVMQEATR